MGLLDELLGGLSEEATGQTGTAKLPQEAGGMGGVLAALLPVVLAMLANRGGGAQAGGGGGLNDLLGQVLGGAQRGGGMGDLLGQVLGGGQAGSSGGPGGLADLLNEFQRAGFGRQAASWVGSGQNLPVSPDAIAQVFGRDGLSRIAAQAGLSEQEASIGLSQLLPEVVDRVTPKGEVPELGELSASVDAMARRLGF